MPELSIAPEQVAWLILKLRSVDGKVLPSETEHDEDEPRDHPIADALESQPGDPEIKEISGLLAGLDSDELLDLVALMWVGRGTYGVDEWDEARSAAADEKTTSTTRYLLGTPLAADYLAEGLAAFGYDPAELESEADEG